MTDSQLQPKGDLVRRLRDLHSEMHVSIGGIADVAADRIEFLEENDTRLQFAAQMQACATIAIQVRAKEQLVEIAALRAKVDELMVALAKSETSLGKIAGWLGRLATAAEQRAKDTRFKSLADANAADAKNYRSTIVSIMPALESARAALAMYSQDRGTA